MACPVHNIIDFDSDDDVGLSYSEYLQLKPLLETQKPLTNVHDEHLFIVVHQVYELWFKQIIFELTSIQDIFLQPYVKEENMFTVNNRLSRITKILAVLVEQMKILETMTPLDFSDFRTQLNQSSGFQSWQFRVLENKIGVKKENRINYNKSGYSEVFKEEVIKDIIQESEETPSLFECVQAWLERTPGLKDDDFDFWDVFTKNCYVWFDTLRVAAEAETDPKKREQKYNNYVKTKEEFEQVLIEENYEVLRKRGDRQLSWKALQGALMIYYYRDEVVFHSPFQMITFLMDIDSLVTKWRSNHVLLVQRQLGTKSGTGGSSGYMYLRSTVSDRYKAFLDFFNLSNYLIPREYIPKLHNQTRRRLASVQMPKFEKHV